MEISKLEEKRLELQKDLDKEKSQEERNRLGQFATPTALAQEILKYGKILLGKKKVRFFDPAFGTGAFFSALLTVENKSNIETAKGFEIDKHYGLPAKNLWKDYGLDLSLTDFTKEDPPEPNEQKYNFLICNPPYVRHHHIINGDKKRLQKRAEEACGIRFSGLSGLYCYFLGLSHKWMQDGAVAGWLIPSEFMSVNYGQQVKNYLLDKVTLLRIHRFDPKDVQFDDALVSSAIVWFIKTPPPSTHSVKFTFGGSFKNPKIEKYISVKDLREETKWTRFPTEEARADFVEYKLSDLFEIKRGIATGDNNFFILNIDKIKDLQLSRDCFRPILPSPRYLGTDLVNSDSDGNPILEKNLFLLDCKHNEKELKEKYPKVWDYLLSGEKEVSKRYLCSKRKKWYFQEERNPAPILCTYFGRSDKKSGRPFNFILNKSNAIATNSYLLLYPKPIINRAIQKDPHLINRIWETLNSLSPESLLGEGRVYGGGLHKLEPKELANVDATSVAELVPELMKSIKMLQQKLF